MTAIADTKHGNLFPLGNMILLAIALTVMGGALKVIYSSHATEKHSSAVRVRKCLNDNGPHQIWRSAYDNDTFYFICNMPDGSRGIQPLVRVAEQLREKTAFAKKSNGQAFMRYMMRQGEQQLGWTGGTIDQAIEFVLTIH